MAGEYNLTFAPGGKKSKIRNQGREFKTYKEKEGYKGKRRKKWKEKRRERKKNGENRKNKLKLVKKSS